MENFVSTAKASKARGVSRSRIVVLAQQGKIKGAKQLDNGVWLIPEDWVKSSEQEKAIMECMVTVFEASVIAGVTRSAIYKALNEGRLRGYQGKRGAYKAWAIDYNSLMSYRAERA